MGSGSDRKIASTLGKYRLIAELGTGGMANVFLAVMRGHGGFHKLFVLKVPRDEVVADPSMLAMFIDEARIAARLNHPNVVQTFEVFHHDGRDIIVMEYLDGYTLHDAITVAGKQERTLPQALHLRVISEALTGLHYAHEARDFDGSPLELVHRDISPHNVFMTFDGQVKVLDFGIAKAAVQTHQTEFGTFKGKVRYMPREQLAGSHVDRRTDIFAVGTMIWECAVGHRLWKTNSDVEVMSAIIAGDVPMPRDVKPDAPEALDAICRKAMAHDKSDRYATCAELQADLEKYLAELPEHATLRDMVSFMESVFAEQRATRRKVIDEQLKTVATKGDGGESSVRSMPIVPLPAVNTASVSGSGTPVTVTGRGGPAAAGRSRYARSAALGALAIGAAATGIMLWRAAHRPPPESLAEARAASVSSAPLPPSASEPPPPIAPSAAAQIASAALASSAPPQAPPKAAAQAPRTPKREAEPQAPTAPAPAEPPGVLSFTTYPWTRVYEGGKLLGTTPLYRVSLSAGTHVLTLENPDEGVKTTYTVTIKSGESVTRSIALK